MSTETLGTDVRTMVRVIAPTPQMSGSLDPAWTGIINGQPFVFGHFLTNIFKRFFCPIIHDVLGPDARSHLLIDQKTVEWEN